MSKKFGNVNSDTLVCAGLGGAAFGSVGGNLYGMVFGLVFGVLLAVLSSAKKNSLK